MSDAPRPPPKVAEAAADMWAVLDDLEAKLDPWIYPQLKKEDFAAADDREYMVPITAKQWRAIGSALTKAQRGAS